MEIMLAAADSKKELMIQFCIAYCGILSKHNVRATGVTGKYVAEATGLPVECLMAGPQGGVQQIASRVTYDEVDVLLFFRDPSPEADSGAEEALFRLCDLHNIPLATNIATAEALIMALDRGDLDWRRYERENRSAAKKPAKTKKGRRDHE